MSVNDYFIVNFYQIEKICKKSLKSRYGEGISLYYDHLLKKGVPKKKLEESLYPFLTMIKKPNGSLNYRPKKILGYSIDDYIEEDHIHNNFDLNRVQYNIDKLDVEYVDERIELMIDLKDEVLSDFLLNNPNNDKWIKIYRVIYDKKIKLDLFEEIVFDYMFNKGLTIKKISEITGNSRSWVQLYRKSLIEKIKKELDGNN